MSTLARTRELLLAHAKNITDIDSQDCLTKRENLQTLQSSLENVIRSVIIAQNELSIISKLPPEIFITIAGFVMEPRCRESMFELVDMTHVCQHWRSTLISAPHLWSSIFVKNDPKEFVATCLQRSQKLPLTVHFDLIPGDGFDGWPDCTCAEWSSETRISEYNPCRYHNTITPLLKDDHADRIRKLDISFDVFEEDRPENILRSFRDALEDYKFFVLPLPSLESLDFRACHIFYFNTPLPLPNGLFGWGSLPPTKLRHLRLVNCHGAVIQAVRNLASFELVGEDENMNSPITLHRPTFHSFISNNSSLESLALTYCDLLRPPRSPEAAPVRLSKLKSLRLAQIDELPDLLCLMEIPAFKTLSSLRILTRTRGYDDYRLTDFLVHANSEEFCLHFDAPDGEKLVKGWLGATHGASPSLAFVRFEARNLDFWKEQEIRTSPLPLFENAKVLEIGAYFAGPWYGTFWNDLERIGSQLTTLRLEVIDGGEKLALAQSVKQFARARWEKGVPLRKLERMTFEGMSGTDEATAERRWEEFQAGLGIDQYLTAL